VTGGYVGRVYRDGIGSTRYTVVGVDERFVYVKRSDSSKKNLATAAGAYSVARSEFQSWQEVPA